MQCGFLVTKEENIFVYTKMGSLNGKSSYPVNAGVPQASILGSTLYLLYIYDLPDGVICDIVICADDTTLYSMCNQASDLVTTGIGF